MIDYPEISFEKDFKSLAIDYTRLAKECETCFDIDDYARRMKVVDWVEPYSRSAFTEEKLEELARIFSNSMYGDFYSYDPGFMPPKVLEPLKVEEPPEPKPPELPRFNLSPY